MGGRRAGGQPFPGGAGPPSARGPAGPPHRASRFPGAPSGGGGDGRGAGESQTATAAAATERQQDRAGAIAQPKAPGRRPEKGPPKAAHRPGAGGSRPRSREADGPRGSREPRAAHGPSPNAARATDREPAAQQGRGRRQTGPARGHGAAQRRTRPERRSGSRRAGGRARPWRARAAATGERAGAGERRGRGPGAAERGERKKGGGRGKAPKGGRNATPRPPTSEHTAWVWAEPTRGGGLPNGHSPEATGAPPRSPLGGRPPASEAGRGAGGAAAPQASAGEAGGEAPERAARACNAKRLPHPYYLILGHYSVTWCGDYVRFPCNQS